MIIILLTQAFSILSWSSFLHFIMQWSSLHFILSWPSFPYLISSIHHDNHQHYHDHHPHLWWWLWWRWWKNPSKIFSKLRDKVPTPYMMMYWTLCTLDEVCDSKDDEKSKLKSFWNLKENKSKICSWLLPWTTCNSCTSKLQRTFHKVFFLLQ